MLVAQLHDLLHGLDGYGSIGVGRDDGKEAGEYAAIFYNKKRIRMLSHGDFWLSPTRQTRSGDGMPPASESALYGKFRDERQTDILLFQSPHGPWGVVARRESAKLVVKKNQGHRRQAARDTDGRFQRRPDRRNLSDFRQVGHPQRFVHTAARLRFAENGTFNSFDPNMKPTAASTTCLCRRRSM